MKTKIRVAKHILKRVIVDYCDSTGCDNCRLYNECRIENINNSPYEALADMDFSLEVLENNRKSYDEGYKEGYKQGYKDGIKEKAFEEFLKGYSN